MIEAGYIASDLENKQHATTTDHERIYPLEAGIHAAMTGSSAKLANRASASPRRMSEAIAAAASAENPKHDASSASAPAHMGHPEPRPTASKTPHLPCRAGTHGPTRITPTRQPAAAP